MAGVEARGELLLVDGLALAQVRGAAKLAPGGRVGEHNADAAELLDVVVWARRLWVVEGQARDVEVRPAVFALEALGVEVRVVSELLDAGHIARHAVLSRPSTLAPVGVHVGVLVDADGDERRLARLRVLREEHEHWLVRFAMQVPGCV